MTRQSICRLSRQQAAVLRTIHRMERSNEGVGHDLEGDLSVCTGNLPLTEAVLERRGLLTRELVPEGLFVPHGYYLYRLTDAGREAITAHVFRNSVGDARISAYVPETP